MKSEHNTNGKINVVNQPSDINIPLFLKTAEYLVQYRKWFMAALLPVALISILFAFQARIDTSGVSFGAAHTKSFDEYKDFIKSFGTDDFIVLAVKNALKISDPKFQKRIAEVHRELGTMDPVLKVVDLSGMASSGLIGLVSPSGNFWDETSFSAFRSEIPGFSRLISKDMKTIAFIVQINNEKYNGLALVKQIQKMKNIITSAFPEHPSCYVSGVPVLRAAFERYNLESAIIFSTLGLIFGILTALYIFKTIWAGVLVLLCSIFSLAGTLGIMGCLNIPLNLATGLSFGFILVVSTTTVFHIVSKYFQFFANTSKTGALKQTLQITLFPCLMCALTTGAGFFCMVISPVPMVRQAGIIIPLGIITAFCYAVIITVFCLPALPLGPKGRAGQFDRDIPARIIKGLADAGFTKPGFSVLTGMVFFMAMAWGIPNIEADRHLTPSMLKDTREAKDLAYIEQHTQNSSSSFSVVLNPIDKTLHSKKFWYELSRFEKQIKSINGVRTVESLTPLIFRLSLRFSPTGPMPELVFRQIQSKSMINTYYDHHAKKLRLIVHLQNLSPEQIESIFKQIRRSAEKIFDPGTAVVFSGQLIYLRSQTGNLVASQIQTLILSLFMITLLMIIQLRSLILGLLSLIPNLFPLITIFGLMGWLNIPLDPLTIFAAVISFALSVDDSIHYLTHLKHKLVLTNKADTLQSCLYGSFQDTSRSLLSTTLVLCCSVTGLLFSSFSHVVYLGFLIFSAAVVALISDLVFLPALALKFNILKKLLLNTRKKAI